MDFAFRIPFKSKGILIFLILSTLLTSIDASIHIYQKQVFNEVGNAYLLPGGSEGLEVSLSSEKSSTDGLSFIRFENITFWRTQDAADEHSEMERITGLIQAVIFEVPDRNNIGGSAYGGQRSICCTPDLAKLEGCKQGEVIRIPSTTEINWPIVLNIQFSGNNLLTHMDNTKVPIQKTGMYNLFFIACDPKLKGTVMNGKTVWKNPDGYLPGRMAPLMKFYVYMALAYLLLGAIWFWQYVRFWEDILQLQHCIAAVIGLGLFEMMFWYLDYSNFNKTGMRPVVITAWVVTFGAIKKTLSRLLILSVSMGYGVVLPTLGGLTSKVLLIGATYFLASELLDITEHVGTVNDISGRARLFLALPDAFLDAFLILWIFTSLSKTLEQLHAKRILVKLDLYRKFSNALAVAVIASVAWITYEIYFKATDPFNERWQSAWIITAFWDIL
ncbi:transmembrane protein 87B-like [Hibiscus syriacus]|uniref:transmembrane protein 87B-like n=1 Tax=Hibiscus syriacus TaxID=106335 RepID=UPI0019226C30|nr:transmembrane protein 87B-like [Hibiscus syriacus]